MYKYTSVDDLRTIFQNSLVMYDGEPHIVMQIDSYNVVIIRNVMKGNALHDSIDSPLFDFEPVKLGYVNSLQQGIYVSRNPTRQYKQGLTNAHINAKLVNPFERIGRISIESVALSKTIMNMYPSLENVLNYITNDVNVKSQAFCRIFKIGNDGKIFYREQDVGLINFENAKPTFRRDKNYLMSLWEKYDECF